MAKKNSVSAKHTKVPLIWFILAIIALAIPLTVIFSQQQTSLRQEASGKKNYVKKLTLSEPCGKNHGYSKAFFTCKNGVTGKLHGREKECHSRSYYMDFADSYCGGYPEPLILTCLQNEIAVTPPGTTISVRLTDENKRPIPNATILWLYKGENMLDPLSSTTDEKGMASTYYNLPNDLEVNGTDTVDVATNYPYGGVGGHFLVYCTTTVHYSSPAHTP